MLTYSLKGRIDITHTPLNISADAEVGGLDSDEIVVRFPIKWHPRSNPSSHYVFQLLQDFRVSVNMLREIANFTNLQLQHIMSVVWPVAP